VVGKVLVAVQNYPVRKKGCFAIAQNSSFLFNELNFSERNFGENFFDFFRHAWPTGAAIAAKVIEFGKAELFPLF
jgi:hypothetical protein